MCGNGVVEGPAETLRLRRRAGCPGRLRRVSRNDVLHHLRRDRPRRNCSAACVATPVTACVGGDGCCPPGCTAVDDSDCPAICGDGVVETGETCDRAITAGQPGACAAPATTATPARSTWRRGRSRAARARAATRRSPAASRRRLLPGRLLRRRPTATAPRSAATIGSARARPAIRPAVARPPARTTAIRARPSSWWAPRHLQRRLPPRPDHDLLGRRSRPLLPDGLHARQRQRTAESAPRRGRPGLRGLARA